MMNFEKFLTENFKTTSEGIYTGTKSGYWSNLSMNENTAMLKKLQEHTCNEVIRNTYPQLEEIIFSPKRHTGLPLLEMTNNDICIDYGCMWGALTIPLAKKTAHVFAVDQTLESILFLKARLREEKINNVSLICNDIRTMPEIPSNLRPNIAIVNGVLEWVPETGVIELKSFWGKQEKRIYSGNPKKKQVDFLKNVLLNLKSGGKLYLAIENRYDFRMFLGEVDPHSGIPFTSILPRFLANIESKILLKRPYLSWIYSFEEIRNILLKDVGFTKVDLYACFPHYHFPQNIVPYSKKNIPFTPSISVRNDRGKIKLKRMVGRSLEYLFFNFKGAHFFSPSIIALAYK
ncbi:MAG: class I SAM-dependent methyltransferase [Oligoflexia bacterium]|nr:class I SAM-dependent methyltransferase [Oligoflexia bacterium]